MRNPVGIVAIIGLSVSGCASRAQSNVYEMRSHCEGPSRLWSDSKRAAPYAWTSNAIKLGKSGSIHWNGVSISYRTFGGYLTLLSAMQPVPQTYLIIEDGTNCSRVKRLREEIEKQLQCGNTAFCAEFNEVDWRRLKTFPWKQ